MYYLIHRSQQTTAHENLKFFLKRLRSHSRSDAITIRVQVILSLKDQPNFMLKFSHNYRILGQSVSGILCKTIEYATFASFSAAEYKKCLAIFSFELIYRAHDGIIQYCIHIQLHSHPLLLMGMPELRQFLNWSTRNRKTSHFNNYIW